RKPAAWLKRRALMVSARLGGLRAALKVVASSRWNTYRQGFDAAHEAGIHPLRFANHLDPIETFQHFLPHDLQLQFGEPHADTAMDAEAERQMGAGPGAVADELVGVRDAVLLGVP